MNISLGLLIKLSIVLFLSLPSYGEVIEKKYASFKLLNKSTNKVSSKEILVNKATIWQTLNIKVLYCASTPPNEAQEDYVLIDVYDIINQNKINIYKGWMISSEPELTSLENPIYDLWLVACINDNTS
tara:strand:+ start:215 stop:598 length:384 start_codon:yes stop_codon:yes gene_type:complete